MQTMKASLQTIFIGTVLSFSISTMAEQTKRIPLEDVQRFSTAINQIKKYYVKDTTDKKLFDNAIKGMLSGLDPHSAYLDEDAFKELRTANFRSKKQSRIQRRSEKEAKRATRKTPQKHKLAKGSQKQSR